MEHPTPKEMAPGYSVEGAGLKPGAYGNRPPGQDPIVPAGGNVFDPGLSAEPTSITFYNGATPPPVGGGGRAASNLIVKG